jgi:hypothetical protein
MVFLELLCNAAASQRDWRGLLYITFFEGVPHGLFRLIISAMGQRKLHVHCYTPNPRLPTFQAPLADENTEADTVGSY